LPGTTPSTASTAPPEIAGSDAPFVTETVVGRCEVCGGTDTRLFAAGYDYELITCRNHWQFAECTACTHVWLDPRPSVEALGVIYPPTYYSYNYEQIPAVARKAKEIIDGLKMRKILALGGRTPEHYLDVGCGDGRYLEALARRGVPQSGLFGLELDEQIVGKLQGRGLQVYCERVEECTRFEPGTFDLITMFHVIEHVDSPREVVEQLAGWLAPGGVLAVETPNLDSLDARLFHTGKWGGYHIPRHWHLFRPATLSRLLASVGLEVEAVRYETGHAFWMYSFHHALRYRQPPQPRLARLFDPLASVAPLAAFTAFDRLRATLGAKTSSMLITARKPASA
jgi:2-polyprenyl-3-methyl-5-hydroxy-6-metoxy-1,4-benzoquinol methylase